MASASTLGVASLGLVDYQRALDLQAALVRERQQNNIGDTLLLLEHPHVFTLGRGADSRYLLDPPAGVPIYRVARGGQVTYHGPGQLVGYPILRLEGAARDIALYLRNLERGLIEALACCGIAAQSRQGLTGVWVGARKIASIGVGIRRWTTFHGFAINVNPDLRYFETIVPCGLQGCEMTSIASLGHPEITVANFTAMAAPALAAALGYAGVTAIPAASIWSTQADAPLSPPGQGV